MVLNMPDIFNKQFEEPERNDRITQIRHEIGLFSGIIPLTGITSPYTLDLSDIQIANLNNLSVTGDVEWTGTFEPNGGISGNLDMNGNSITDIDAISGVGAGDITLGSDIAGNGKQITALGFLNVAGDIECQTITFNAVTSYWGCSGQNFSAGNTETDNVDYDLDGFFNVVGNPVNEDCHAPVTLPHGAIVTAVIVYGADAGNTWALRRRVYAQASAAEDLATAAINTEDSTISNATINNSTHKYWLTVTGVFAGDDVRGARITYTYTTLP